MIRRARPEPLVVDAPRLTRRLWHHVLVSHRGTGRPLEGISVALLDPVWPHWVLRLAGSEIGLSTTDAFRDGRPAETRLRLAPRDPLLATTLENQGVRELTLQRDADARVEVELKPLPRQIRVVLTDDAGAPEAGETVRIKVDGSSVAAPEGDPGVYTTAPRSWDDFSGPLKLMVDNREKARVAVDYEKPVTVVRLVV